MKRASYRDGVDWIAFNDEPSELDAEIVQGFISVHLLASIFDIEPSRIAKDVVRYRNKARQR